MTSIDAMVEGVHFKLGDGWATPAEVGRRALAGALSDIAAMGADGGEAFVALALPPGFAEEDALALALAADELALATGTAIAGGDVVAGPALAVTVSVTGWLPAGREPVGRDGAAPGELVAVTGSLGAGRAALELMGGAVARTPETEPALERARAPWPRLAEGRALAAAGASAMIDVSDGLAADAAQLARASAVGLRLRLEDVPVAEGVAAVAGALGADPAALAAAGGEDYELLVCAPAERREALERALARARAAHLDRRGARRSCGRGVAASSRGRRSTGRGIRAPVVAVWRGADPAGRRAAARPGRRRGSARGRPVRPSSGARTPAAVSRR